MKDVVLLAVSFYLVKQDLAKGTLLRSHDESPSGPWCTTLSPVVDVTYQTANASKKGADIDAGHVAAASNSVRPRTKKRML